MTSVRVKHSVRTAASVGLLVVAAGFASPQVQAGVPVIDYGHITAQVTEFGKELARYEAQLREWQNLLSQNPLQRVQEAANLRPKIGSQLQMKTDSDGAEQQCNQYGGGPLGAIGNVFQISFNPQGNLRDEQKKLCALQVALENRKWNENVLMIRQMELHQDKLDAVANSRSSSMTQGEAGTKTTDVVVAQADFDANMQKGKARIDTLNNMIESVKHMQSMAGQQLLAGQKPSGFVASAAANLAQGVVLKAALDIGNRQCGSELGVKCSN